MTSTKMKQKLHNIIKHYKQWRDNNPDNCIEHCKQQDNLEEAILVAALSEGHLGKRHNHQRRINGLILEKFAANLVDKQQEIETAQSFDKLLQVVESCKIKGIGELTCYDTTTRIGARLGLKPDKIYLHAGTKKGAEKLLGKKIYNKSISKKDLPSPFREKDLSEDEIEDILCIYKDRFDEAETEKISKKGCH